MAMAPEQTGIGIRRHFTTEGIDPYDEVVWERRDARITNYRDGVVAFEQRGVEFPTGWSLNAANIVAQKYFRGALGSPGREQSLREVIDRVADTITDWGAKDGYFVDDAEAETFRAELKHLVVHQKAAFNSPVWFNIGVRGEPRQASACQPYHALVSTPEGLIPIGRLVEDNAVGTKVMDAHGLTRVSAVKANGRKPVLRLSTKSGHVLEVTGDHLVWRAGGVGGGKFVPAADLRVGDRLTWHRHTSWGAGQIGRQAVAEAALAGWLQADGFVGQDDGTNRPLTIEAMTVTDAERAWVLDAIDTVFPGVHRHERLVATQSSELDCRRTRLYGAPLHDFVERWDLRARGTAMTVPESMFTAPLPVVGAYLRSLFQAEGYVSLRERSALVGLAMISEELVRGIQALLLRFGVFCRVRFAADRRADRHGTWVLAIRTAGDRRRFADEIGFIDPRKAEKLEASFDLPGSLTHDSKQLEIAGIEEIGEMNVYDIQTDSGEYLSGGLRVHNCFILAVDDTMQSILNWYVEEGTIFKGGSGSGINLSNIRSSQEHLKGGGTASGPVSFMRGADASAGTIKCLHADTPVVTDRGVVAIKDTRVDDHVLTRFGYRAVEAVHDNGVRPLLRVRTSFGDNIVCTPEHRFWVRGRWGEGWREAGELEPDDHVLIHVGASDSGRLQPLKPVAPGYRTEIGHELPVHVDEAMALWLGWVYGDGSVTSRPGAKFVAVQIGDDDTELVHRYRALTQGVFGRGVHLYVDRHVDRPDASASIRFASSQIVRFLEANGLRKEPCAELRVPALIQASPSPVRAAFLAGLFEADGHVANGYAWLSSISSALAHDVHRLLLSIGIPSKIGRIEDRREAHGSVPVYTVRVIGAEGIRRFAKQVGFLSDRKQHCLEAAVVRKDASPYECQWFLPHVHAELSEVWSTATNQNLRRALAPYCRYAQPRRMSLLRARVLLESFPEELGATTLTRFAYGDELYAAVTTEPAGDGPTFDLTVAGVHEYLVNSVVTHNSGGKTRRAAKMVILNADHPDIEDFIWCKAIEERKARVLRDAGFDMDLDGKDSHSTQYQNANNSVRVTDEFMQAVVDDGDWHLRAVKTGEPLRTVKARHLFRQIAEATWECADPGMQFDTTINRWHTAANTGRINGSNPCFPGDQRVHTDKGLIRFDELFDRARRGETFGVYTHDATNPDAPSERVEITKPEAYMITGLNEIVRLRFSNGMELRCTANHRLHTVNRGYVAASDLTPDDQVKTLDLTAPAVNADLRLPVSTDVASYSIKGDWSSSLRLPEKWTPEFAHYLGWLVGDGCITGDVVTTVYGGGDDQDAILPRHLELLSWMNGDRVPTPSKQANGTVQLRQSRRVIARFLEALGITHAKAPDKVVPWSIEQAPPEAVAAFLRGLFDADGCVYDGSTNRYVGLGSASPELLRGVQRLLSTFGISSRIYQTQKDESDKFIHVGTDGSVRVYVSKPMWDLRISNRSIATFADTVGFSVPAKDAKLTALQAGRPLGVARTTGVRMVERTDDGVELTYNLCEPRNHSYIVQGLTVSNCSEYMHLDNSACNLASLNLLKFLAEDGTFDVEGFKAAIEVVFTAQEILVGNADYPTEKIGDNARRFRQLGLGYANLGAMLMALGIAYDSDAGRTWAAAITSLMTGHAYATSARTAARMGPFAGYTENREPTNRVLRMHRDEAAGIDDRLATRELVSAAQEAWARAVEWAEDWGVRNSQATVLAPTGCLVGGSLVATDRGLVPLRSLGDPDGEQWQDLDVQVATDDGPKAATRFYVNGLEPVVNVDTARGYRIQGTTQHRVKVVDEVTGAWEWKRFADMGVGDLVPLALHQLVGARQDVPLPPMPEAYWTGEHHVEAPRTVTPELAELVGYFMGDGSLRSRGLRFCVADTDFDVVKRLEQLGKEVFKVAASVSPRQGYTEVAFSSVRLTLWWEACGFARRLPHEGHTDTGYVAHVPEAILHSNDPEVYRAFLRGLFEADGTVTAGVPSLSSTSLAFASDVQSVLLALGYPTTRRLETRTGWGESAIAVLSVLNASYASRWSVEIGFLSARKTAAVASGTADASQAERLDYIPVTRAMVDRLAPGNDRLRKVLLMEVSRGRVSRRIATELFERTADAELCHLLSYFYDRVTSAELGDEELTYDISVPENVTYVANGFVSHNTIGLMMDCDTTGIEPDLGLCKTKKLVGGGTMSIVNQTVPRALRRLGYSSQQSSEIIAYIDEHKTILGAPHISSDHLDVFACSMGDNVIHYLGHVRMMAAVQPWISGAISKCVAGDTLLATADGLVRIGSLHGGEAPDTFRPEIVAVASTGGVQKTDAFYYGGLRPVRKVVLRSGHRVVGTPNHRLQVGGSSGLVWRRLDEIEVGEYVATQYGSEMWSALPARFDDFVPTAPYGSQKLVDVRHEMTEELAFLLGAYASEGHITTANWTVTITNSVDTVLDRVVAAWRSEFGLDARIVRQRDKCPGVVAASKTVVEFLQYLGCGGRASTKRIPDAVLRSPRTMVLAFLQGLALDAYVSVTSMPKWAICLDSPALLDDLQAVLTNLGIVHSRISKSNTTYDKSYDEVYAVGDHARRLAGLVPFLEPEKAARSAQLQDIAAGRSSADVVPGITLLELLALVPRGHRSEFSFLHDVRTSRATRRTVERVAAVPGVRLPAWLQTVVDDNLHFSPVESVVDAGEQEVFDISVPATSAFVGNGIVNHNTINMPEQATVEEMEQLHIDAWRMGLKAVAVYRDNCKVAQPLSATKKDAAPVVQPVLVKQPVRERLPRMRRSKTFSFRVADCHGYVTVGEYDDGRPGEIFLRVAKQGSTLAGIMDAFAISVSHALQYGVPLRAFVDMYTNMRFEPAGITDDAEIRFASSLVDYIFRRLAVEYLPAEERAELGILTVEERMQPTLPGVEEQATPTITGTEVVPDPAPVPTRPPAPARPAASPAASDAPYCYVCGVVMQRAGACFVCSGCGTTSGCS